MTRTTMTARRLALGAVLLAAMAALATPAAAQSVRPDARWQGWLGCWQPVTAASADSYADWMATRARDAGLPTLCIIPSTSVTAVDFVTIAGGKETARETVDAANSRLARHRDDCNGWESASWATDGRRIYTRSQYDCAGGVSRAASGMLSMSAAGQLLDIQEFASGGAKSVRVARYQSVPAPAGFALDSTQVLSADAVPVTAARTAIAASLTGADIVDAVNNADSLVVEAWLVERGERFNLDAKHLLALADAGVPGRITDLMIAMSYPNVFAFDRSARLATARVVPQGGRVYATLPGVDPYGGYMGYSGYPYGYGPLGYNPFLYGNGANGYGYSGYGYGGYGRGGYGYGGYLYQPPIVIVRNGGTGGSGRVHGRVVNGHGYTRDPSPSSGSQTSGRSTGSSSGSSSGTGTSSGTTSGTSTSSEGTTRQAKPRP